MEVDISQELRATLLKHLPTSGELQELVRHQFWAALTIKEQALLSLGILTFFKVPPSWGTIAALHFSRAAGLEGYSWEFINCICEKLHRLSGVREVILRGQGFCWHNQRNDFGVWQHTDTQGGGSHANEA